MFDDVQGVYKKLVPALFLQCDGLIQHEKASIHPRSFGTIRSQHVNVVGQQNIHEKQ